MGGHTVVAGAVASVQDWLDFDKDWTAALRENGLLYFRMTEFAQSTRQFKVGWKANETRRREFLLRLAQIIVDHVACWIGVCVSQKDYDAADSIYQLHEFLQPYPLCGLTCLELAHKWQKIHRLEYLPMEYVFEDGDEYSDQLWRQVKTDFGRYPLFRKKLPDKPSAEEPSTPLQVGDFAAYEIGKFYTTIDPIRNQLFGKFRESFRLIESLPQQWGQLEETAIRVGLNLRKVPRR